MHTIVSLSWPQEVPARALRMLIRGVAREMMLVMCWGKGEVGVEGDPQDAGVAGEGERGVVECDCGVRVGLAFVRGKEGDRGLGGRNGESKVVSPQRDLVGMLAEGRGGGSKVRVGVGVSEVVGIGGSQRMGVWVGGDEVVKQCRGGTRALRDSCSCV